MTSKVKRKCIVYVPPSRKALEQYAQKVCERLAERDISYLSPDIADGLTGFLNLSATILAKHKNAENNQQEEQRLDSNGK